MFNKAKDKDEEFEMDTVTSAAPPQRRSSKSVGPSILGPDIAITGSIQSEGEIQLDGAVEGDVRAGSLTIGEHAAVKGEVEAENALIRGHVSGSVRARHVQLASTARIEGDIIHSTLAIESGAYFEGNCRRADDPIGKPSKSSSQAPQSSSTSSSSTPSSSGSGGAASPQRPANTTTPDSSSSSGSASSASGSSLKTGS